MSQRPLMLNGAEPADPVRRVQALAWDGDWVDLNDPALAAFARAGSETASGAAVNMATALRNTAVFRSVSLISYAIGMLPLQLINEETKGESCRAPAVPSAAS